MLQEYIDASVAGKIIAVDWIGIEGMLGESPERLHKCSICEDNKAFPPQVVKENEFSEADISKILKAMPINYMAKALAMIGSTEPNIHNFCQHSECCCKLSCHTLDAPVL